MDYGRRFYNSLALRLWYKPLRRIPPGFLTSREDPADDLLNRDFLNINVAYGQFVQERFTDGNHAFPLNLELNSTGSLLDDLTVFAEVFGGTVHATFALDPDQLGISKAVHDLTEPAIEENRAVVNDDDSLAELLDISHVMAGQQNGGLVADVVFAQEFAHGFLRNDIQPNSRLIEEEDPGLV